MFPSLDLRISESAKVEIDALLRSKETGSMPVLLMPVVGVERRRIIEIGIYPPAVLEEMITEYASWGASLVQDCHGTKIAIFDDDMLESLQGKVLLFSDGEYSLATN